MHTPAINHFLNRHEWGTAKRTVIASDASKRRYIRLCKADGETAIVMVAPPSTGENITPFLNIAAHLRRIGLAAPEIYDFDQEHGLILMQDFGDDLYFDVVRKNPAQELCLYRAALDVLDEMHRAPAPQNCTDYMPLQMAQLSQLAGIWYEPNAQIDIETPMRHALERLDWSAPVLVLRDYHAQNLIWRPHENGHQKVGLLDFQDAQMGHPLYDVVSLLHDARRDLDVNVYKTLTQYLESKTTNAAEHRRAMSTLSAQRNLRILGVFSRLCLRDAKAKYIDLIPRVWCNLQYDLQHPDLHDLAKTLRALLPPTATKLRRLKQQCGAYQTA